MGQRTGDVSIRLTAGANNVRIERPAGVHVRLNLHGGAGRIDFDQQRLNGVGDTVLETTGATEATDLYLVDIVGGAGKITVAEVG